MTFMGPFVDEPDDFLNSEKALDLGCKKVGLERQGGPSGRGWSSIQNFMQCPMKYKLDREAIENGEPLNNDSLEIGSYFHEFMAVHYTEGCPVTPRDLMVALVAVGARPANIKEAWRLYEHYSFYYGDDDKWDVLAIEELAEVPDVYSCRYDLIVRVTSDIYPSGTYIVDHKTASRFTAVVTQCWDHHGEILGQQWLYEQLGLEEKYGPLSGTIINLVGRQKNPEYLRLFIPVKRRNINWFEENVIDGVVKGTLPMTLEYGGYLWLKENTACTAHFGICPHYSKCWE